MHPRGGHCNAACKELRDNEIVTVEDHLAMLTPLFRPESAELNHPMRKQTP